MEDRCYVVVVGGKVYESSSLDVEADKFLNCRIGKNAGQKLISPPPLISPDHSAARMLYLIGLGLSDETDITVKGLSIVRAASRVYLEAYTSILLVEKSILVCPPPMRQC